MLLFEVTPSSMIAFIGLALLLIAGIGLFIFLRQQSPADTVDETTDEEAIVDDTVNKIEETEDYMRRIERLSRKEIDRKNNNKR